MAEAEVELEAELEAEVEAEVETEAETWFPWRVMLGNWTSLDQWTLDTSSSMRE